MNFKAHLSMQQITLSPSSEWEPSFSGWMFLRLEQGHAYWMNVTGALEIVTNAMLVLSPAGAGVLRVSRLGEAILRCFSVQPDQLGGLLTIAEQKFLRQAATHPKWALRSYHPEDPMAIRFAQICDEAKHSFLPQRTRMLELFSELFAPDLRAMQPDEEKFLEARDRLEQLLAQYPETELLNVTTSDFAQKLHCSPRHFSRLFYQQYGISLRRKQTELRLAKACQLLRDPSSKIINVALECGYNSLGLFNSLFKKHYGVTPGKWQRGNARPSASTMKKKAKRSLISLLLCGLLIGGGAPGAGAQTNSLTGALGAQQVRFNVQGYEISGNTVLKPMELARVFQGFTGTNLGMETIRQALSSLVLAYRGRGYSTVGVRLPQQQLTNGIVRVVVTEGRLSEIRIVDNKHYSSNNVLRALPGLRTNLLLNSKLFQADLDRANANRDRQIYPEIQPGPEPGSSVLLLRVKDRFPLHGRLELNTFNSPNTPDLRINANLSYQNLWQREHSAGLQYGFTPQAFKEPHPSPERFFDYPLISYYSAFYRLPLAAPKSAQEVLIQNPTSFGYDERTRQFRLPPSAARPELTVYASRSTSDTGVRWSNARTITTTELLTVSSRDSGQDLTRNESLGFRFSRALPGSSKINSAFSLGADFKSFDLRSFNTNNFYYSIVITNEVGQRELRETQVNAPQPHRQTTVHYLPLSLRGDLSRLDRSGLTSLGVQANVHVRLPGLSDAEKFQVASGRPSGTGAYVTVMPSLAREQRLYKEWTVLLRADGQWASQPLISNEQLGLGGVTSVRGYHEGEVYGDTGWKVTLEPRTPLLDVGMVDGTMPMRLRGSVFMDYGQAYLLEAEGRKDETDLWGAGLGVSMTVGHSFDLRVAVAWALIDSPLIETGDYRVHFQVGAQF